MRYNSDSTWLCDLYSHYSKKNEKYCCVGGFCEYCLPYEGNEHLLGTTDSPQPKRWRAKDEEYYYFVDAAFNVRSEREIDSTIDGFRYEIGNYFRTEEEAQAMADKFKVLLKGGEDETNPEQEGNRELLGTNAK